MRSDEKNEIKPWLVEEWCIPKADAELVAKMEDVLEVYQRPYDPLNPVVCIDETNKQMVIETRIPCEPGHPEKVDSVYTRNGVADIFMISEPLTGKRETVVKESRTAVDFANIPDYTSDVLYPHAEKIILVTDNLNTHTFASFTSFQVLRSLQRNSSSKTCQKGGFEGIEGVLGVGVKGG